MFPRVKPTKLIFVFICNSWSSESWVMRGYLDSQFRVRNRSYKGALKNYYWCLWWKKEVTSKPKMTGNRSKDGLMRESVKSLAPGCKYTSQGLTPLQGHLHLGLTFLLFHGVWSMYRRRRERWRSVGMWRVLALRGPGGRAQALPSITQSHTWSLTLLGTWSYFTVHQNFSSTQSSRALEAGILQNG